MKTTLKAQLAPRSVLKHAAVLEAAMRSFREDGFHLTSMDRVAERAGVSKRTLYNHFDSKDALFDQVVGEMWGRLVSAAMGQPALPEGAVGERLAGLAQRLLAVLLDPDLIGLFRLVLAESERVPALTRALRVDRDPLELLGIGPVLRAEAELGRLRIERIDVAAMHFWGLTINGLFWPRVLGLPAPPHPAELIVREGVEAFLCRYGVPDRRPSGPPPTKRGLHPTTRTRP